MGYVVGRLISELMKCNTRPMLDGSVTTVGFGFIG